MVRIVAITGIDNKAFNTVTNGSLATFCRHYSYDQHSSLAFAKFWEAQGTPPSMLIHLGVVTDISSEWLRPYDITVRQFGDGYYYLYASLLNWKQAFDNEEGEPLTTLVKQLKGKNLYAFL